MVTDLNGPRADDLGPSVESSQSAEQVEASLANVKAFVDSLNPGQRTALGEAITGGGPAGLLMGAFQTFLSGPNPRKQVSVVMSRRDAQKA